MRSNWAFLTRLIVNGNPKSISPWGALQEILDAAAAQGVYLTDAEIVALSGIHKPVPQAASDGHNTANDSSDANSDSKRAELIQDGLSATHVILSSLPMKEAEIRVASLRYESDMRRQTNKNIISD